MTSIVVYQLKLDTSVILKLWNSWFTSCDLCFVYICIWKCCKFIEVLFNLDWKWRWSINNFWTCYHLTQKFIT